MPLSKLLNNHRSFFLSLIQIQGQICIEDDDYCDFIVWMERDMHIERINPAVEFWKLAHKKGKKLFSLCILPNLLGKWCMWSSKPPNQFYSEEELVNDVDGNEEKGPWCYFQTDIEGSKLIGCDNPEWAIQWLYMACFKLDVPQKEMNLSDLLEKWAEASHTKATFYFTLLYSIWI